MASAFLQLIVLRAADLERTVGFYRALGLQFAREQHGTGPVHYACDLGGLVLEVYPVKDGRSSDGATSSPMMLGFRVAALSPVLDALGELGVRTPPAHPAATRALVEDPDGRSVEIRPSTGS
jgi:lactoylglutathione lyase